MKSHRPGLIVAALLAFLAGCRTDGPLLVAAGNEPRFQNWWNYYTRALERMEARRYEEAAADLRVCLGLTPAPRFPMPRDAWRIKTRGMHLLDDYFPHRELGVCLHLLGRDAEAEPLLEKSLTFESSDRARQFLDRARARNKAGLPGPGPALVFPGEDTLVSASPEVEVRVEARGDAYVSALTIGGLDASPPFATPATNATRRLSLPPGEHEVEVVAADLAGRRTVARRRVTVDLQAPAVSVRGRRRGPDGIWTLDLAARDNHGLRRAEWRGRPVFEAAAPGETNRVFHIQARSAEEGDLVVTDRAGNTLRLSPARHLAGAFLSARYRDTAALGLPDRVLVEGTGGLTLTLGCPTSAVARAGAYFIDGEISCPSGLRSLTVAGLPWAVPDGQGDQTVFFAGTHPLVPGDNPVEVVATGARGEVARVLLRVARAQPEYLAPRHRLAVVLPPVLDGELLPRDSGAVAALEAALLHPPDGLPPRFRVLARGEDFLRVLGEHGLSLSSLCQERARIPWGKLGEADVFFCARAYPHHQGVTLRVHAFAADDPAGGWRGAEDVYLPARDGDIPPRLRGLASKLERRFPLLGGEVRATAPDLVAALDPVPAPPGTRFLLVRPGPAGGLADGQVLLLRGTPLEMRLRSNRKDGLAEGLVWPRAAKDLVKPGDLIYTR